ncbi:MAG: hypothetical protein RID09_19185 [Coleofasciculus sp. G1-WW12-02]|uniref:hypothetical protein n=1 Tax=Coleofasciculus sp. TaxID=3100458 RepID=UPI0032FF9DD9
MNSSQINPNPGSILGVSSNIRVIFSLTAHRLYKKAGELAFHGIWLNEGEEQVNLSSSSPLSPRRSTGGVSVSSSGLPTQLQDFP